MLIKKKENKINGKSLLKILLSISVLLIIIYINLIFLRCSINLYYLKDLILNTATGIITGVVIYGIGIKRDNLKDSINGTINLINSIIDGLNKIKKNISSKGISNSQKIKKIKEIYKEIQTNKNIHYDKKIIHQISDELKTGIFKNLSHYKRYENLIKMNNITVDNINSIIRQIQECKYNLQVEYEKNVEKIF